MRYRAIEERDTVDIDGQIEIDRQELYREKKKIGGPNQSAVSRQTQS